MERLEVLSVSPEASWYACRGSEGGSLQRFVVSTPQSRDVCNKPEILGVDYTEAMRAAMVAALRSAPFRALLQNTPEERLCVVNLLRGGLNFGLRRALRSAFGVNRHASAFLSSQRAKVGDRWEVREDAYRKLDIPDQALLVLGDVVATGVTLENGLDVIRRHMLERGGRIKALVFFTIGGERAEEILADLDRALRRDFPDYKGSFLVWLEARFHLVDERTRPRIGIPGTDLVRHEALLSPEFELSQYESPAHPLERCAIYDAGSRAFDIPTYLADVLEYWEDLAGLAREGWTLGEAMRERWPSVALRDREVFRASRSRAWEGVSEAFLDTLADRHVALLPALDGGAEALLALARARISTLTAPPSPVESHP